MLPITATSLTPTPAFGNIHSKFFQTWRPPEATQLMTPGTQLGSYEILPPLGKGGMGEVWRARDSKLGREVAIKTLPEEFAKDEERLARFEREAKLLASLNHPNIAAIYGLEEDNDTRFLVLELVEGDTLAERLKRGAIPVEESLKLALQIAEALEAAHEKGVIHRDLKPANIKVTPDDKIKVLDFGLAKAFAGDGTDASVSQSPTLSMAATQQGVILGTAAYMSPEQARGQEVDKRADVWAFGVVLFEMLTGRGTFDGGTVSDVLAGVLAKEPQWNTLPLNLHPRIRLLLERCFEKEAKDRYHDIADVRVDIQKVLADPDGVIVQPVAEVVQAPPRLMLPWALATPGLVAVASVAGWNLRPERPPEPRPIMRFSHVLPEAIANTQLYLRSMDEMDSRPILGTDEGLAVTSPFFSPNGEWIGYFVPGELRKIAVSGGAPVKVTDRASLHFGASWGTDDTIVFGLVEGIMRVSGNGGTSESLVEIEPDERAHGPQLLPGGEWVLFTLTSGSSPSRWDEAQIVIQSLESGERRVLVQGGSDARYLPTGHLVYALEDVLFAVPFDVDRLEVTGGGVPIVEGVQRAANPEITTASANYGVTDNGSLVYIQGGETDLPKELALINRMGVVERLPAPMRRYAYPRFSPDGTQIAVQISDEQGSNIFIYDISRDRLQQLTFDGGLVPLWTPDGTRITYLAGEALWNIASDFTTDPELLSSRSEEWGIAGPYSWSPDETVLFWDGTGGVAQLTVSEDGQTQHGGLLNETYGEGATNFSQDGKWFSYNSNETGTYQVYIRRYPIGSGRKQQVTEEGGLNVVWARSGRELFYENAGQLWAMAVATEPTLSWEDPVPLFPAISRSGVRPFTDYDVTPDGQRFVVAVEGPEFDEAEARPQINIILNWFEELKEQVPVP